MRLAESANIAAPIITASAVLAVGILANSHRRRRRQNLQERRLGAYEGLWAVTGAAAGIRARGEWAGGPLDARERRSLFDEMTEWYYGKSGGIFLRPRTRELYLKIKENLCCPADKIFPDGALQEELVEGRTSDQARGYLAIHQVSLLRWIMRFDLDILTKPYNQELSKKQVELLRKCGIPLDWWPYKRLWKPKDARENAIGTS